ncbi:hypothetical protein QYZ87_01625 [Porphyromonadaceae bacterium W3.11]|nr:hypothetical protein [Porphyromonadaceae bacterium W3.11]
MKKRVLHIGIRLSIIFVVLCAVSCSTKNSKSDSENEDKEYVEESGESEDELTVEEANELVRQQVSTSPSLEEMFEPYRLTNLALVDPTAPHNTTGESLMSFVEQFSSDINFQKSRTQLDSDTPYTPDYEVGLLEIQLPDSSNFFASWSEIDEDEASFCNGWLGSEMNKEYVFHRKDDGKWYLIEYFSATKEHC